MIALTLGRFSGEETVVVQVGSSPESFHVHKSFLCNASPFFRAALEGQFKESAEGVLKLPEDSPDTFERFLSWLYLNEYKVMGRKKDRSSEGFWREVVRDHSFAEKVQVGAFQKTIIDNLLHEYKFSKLKPMSLKSVLHIYAETSETSSLRRLAVAMYGCISGDWFQDPVVVGELADVPRFTAELVKSIAGGRRTVRKRETLTVQEIYQEEKGNNGSKAGNAKRQKHLISHPQAL
jgi:BTB/POZ domain